DDCGNSSTCTQTLTVADNTAPSVTCPDDITVDCNGDTSPASTGQASVTDNCSDTTTQLLFTDDFTPGNCPSNYTIHRTWSSADSCGNVGNCVQTITVADDTPPSITCPTDVTVECDDDIEPNDLGEATATDDCTPTEIAITHSDSIVNPSCANTHFLWRQWTATDPCGNTASCIQTIRVEDLTPPTIICPPDLTLNCAADTSANALGHATAQDNCAGPVRVFYEDEIIAGSCASNYTVHRHWIAQDGCLNADTCTQILTFFDTTAPEIVSFPE